MLEEITDMWNTKGKTIFIFSSNKNNILKKSINVKKSKKAQ